MKKEDKEQVVAELTERLRTSETLLVADYRGLTMPQIDALRSRLIESGARFTVVKNTLTRRAAEAAGADALLTLLEGPSAIAFLEADGDMVAAAKALADSARESRVLAIRGGVMQGRVLSGGRGTEPREPAAARRAPRPGARGDHRPDHGHRGPRQRPAAEPVRPARRAHRAARWRGQERSPSLPPRRRAPKETNPHRRTRQRPPPKSPETEKGDD